MRYYPSEPWSSCGRHLEYNYNDTHYFAMTALGCFVGVFLLMFTAIIIYSESPPDPAWLGPAMVFSPLLVVPIIRYGYLFIRVKIGKYRSKKFYAEEMEKHNEKVKQIDIDYDRSESLIFIKELKSRK